MSPQYPFDFSRQQKIEKKFQDQSRPWNSVGTKPLGKRQRWELVAHRRGSFAWPIGDFGEPVGIHRVLGRQIGLRTRVFPGDCKPCRQGQCRIGYVRIFSRFRHLASFLFHPPFFTEEFFHDFFRRTFQIGLSAFASSEEFSLLVGFEGHDFKVVAPTI